MSPMYVVAKWLEIGMIPPASVKKVHAAPAPLKKSPPCKPVKKVYVLALVKLRYIQPAHP